MKQVIDTERVPIKLWLDDIEPGALAQAANVANLPFVFKHVALMPDAHQGYGMPIGGVMATKGVVVPNAVGVDIGCGMCAMKTNIRVSQLEDGDLKQIVGRIRELVPVGFKHHKQPVAPSKMPKVPHTTVVTEQYSSALRQLGTLGGGNHFIELQKDGYGYIWVMIHSGSRNLGLKVAKKYNSHASTLNYLWHSEVSSKHELAFLPLSTDVAQDYMTDMKYCVEFALANRKVMMDLVQGAFPDDTGFEPIINIAHNYARMEHHFGQNVMVHRKGATSAKDNEVGIIPGSQGTVSYIVTGRGNEQSFMSCSHGAGRRMGRKQAQRELSLEEEQARLDSQGILHSVRGEKDLDEAPGAYKDIDTVMGNQVDLVNIVNKLEPLAVVKG